MTFAYGPQEFQENAQISDETLEFYKIWFELLNRWNSRINLVAPSTLQNFWIRHAMDSHQIQECLPSHARTIIDLGAGAGFPGIALAIVMRDIEGAEVSLVESNGKKCNFLRTVIRQLSLPAEAIQSRAEDLDPKPYDVVTARAFAPLPKLLTYAHPFWGEDTLGVFPKGESWESEIRNAEDVWSFTATTRPSRTDESARILLVKDLHLKQTQNYGGQSVDKKTA